MAGTDKARARTVAVAQQQSQAPEQAGQPTLQQLIEQLTPQIERALPKSMTAERFTRIVLTTVRTTPKLLQCTPQSVLGATMLAAQHGLEPGPLGLAYIIPRYSNKTKSLEAQFQIGYRGYLELARRSGQVAMIDAEVVYEHDEFEFEKGLAPKLRHVPRQQGDRGAAVAVWAAATFVNGGSAFKVLSVEDVEKYRKRSQTPDNGPWKTDWEPMAMKTALRRLSTFLPLSAEAQMVALADEGIVRELPLDDQFAVDHEEPGPIVDVVEGGQPDEPPAADGQQQSLDACPVCGSTDDAKHDEKAHQEFDAREAQA